MRRWWRRSTGWRAKAPSPAYSGKTSPAIQWARAHWPSRASASSWSRSSSKWSPPATASTRTCITLFASSSTEARLEIKVQRQLTKGQSAKWQMVKNMGAYAGRVDSSRKKWKNKWPQTPESDPNIRMCANTIPRDFFGQLSFGELSWLHGDTNRKS